MTEAYLKASAAVDSGKYLKDNFCKLRKYKEALKEHLPQGSPPVAYERQARLADMLNREIERRKTNFRAFGFAVAKGVLIGLIATVVGGVILFFLLRPFQHNNQDTKKVVQTSPHQQKEPKPSASPSTDRTVTPQRPQGNDKNEHPLSLYCACKANQTFCFRAEMECQKYSPVSGCSQKFSDLTAFNVFEKSKWKEYRNGWVHESKCVIDERRD